MSILYFDCIHPPIRSLELSQGFLPSDLQCISLLTSCSFHRPTLRQISAAHVYMHMKSPTWVIVLLSWEIHQIKNGIEHRQTWIPAQILSLLDGCPQCVRNHAWASVLSFIRDVNEICRAGYVDVKAQWRSIEEPVAQRDCSVLAGSLCPFPTADYVCNNPVREQVSNFWVVLAPLSWVALFIVSSSE